VWQNGPPNIGALRLAEKNGHNCPLFDVTAAADSVKQLSGEGSTGLLSFRSTIS